MHDDSLQFLNNLDKKLWNAADRLHSSLDAAVYKHAVLGLILLKYVSDSFRMRQAEIEKALRDLIRSRARSNIVQEKKYSDRLLQTLRKYHNRSIETAQVIEELIGMAKDFQAGIQRDEKPGISPDEIAFYDALAERPEVLGKMGDETLKALAIELTQQLRKSTTVDWQVRESVRARMRILIKRLLKKHRYPPDGQEEAIKRVVEQADAIASQRNSDNR